MPQTTSAGQLSSPSRDPPPRAGRDRRSGRGRARRARCPRGGRARQVEEIVGQRPAPGRAPGARAAAGRLGGRQVGELAEQRHAPERARDPVPAVAGQQRDGVDDHQPPDERRPRAGRRSAPARPSRGRRARARRPRARSRKRPKKRAQAMHRVVEAARSGVSLNPQPGRSSAIAGPTIRSRNGSQSSECGGVAVHEDRRRAVAAATPVEGRTPSTPTTRSSTAATARKISCRVAMAAREVSDAGGAPARARVRAIRDRLRELYGRPVNNPHGHPIAELVRTVLSQNTNDRNRDVAYERLREALPTWVRFATPPVEGSRRRSGPAGSRRRRRRGSRRSCAELADPAASRPSTGSRTPTATRRSSS